MSDQAKTPVGRPVPPTAVWLKILLVIIVVGAIIMENRVAGLRSDLRTARSDIQTQQQQIADQQTRTRQLEQAVQQLLTDRAASSASVTNIPAGPYCNLHDIAVQNPGC